MLYPTGGAPSSGESEEVAEEAQSSGDEWTARKRSRATAAQRATRQRLNRLRAAKAVREEQKGRFAEAARRLAASEGTNGPSIQSHVTDHALGDSGSHSPDHTRLHQTGRQNLPRNMEQGLSSGSVHAGTMYSSLCTCHRRAK